MFHGICALHRQLPNIKAPLMKQPKSQLHRYRYTFYESVRRASPSQIYLVSNLKSRSLTSRKSNFSQDILESNTWATWNNRRPDLFFEYLSIWEYAPIWTMLCFQPLKIVNLVPLVLNWRFLSYHLSHHQYQRNVTDQRINLHSTEELGRSGHCCNLR